MPVILLQPSLRISKKMTIRTKEIIEEEETKLKQLKEELDSLKFKWFKRSSVLRTIAFLEYLIKQKEEYIKKIKNFTERDEI